MHIWTDTPIDEIWNQLRYLTSLANVRNVLSGRVGSGRPSPWPESDGLDRQAHEITACIRQADEYFQASRHVGLETRPLLHFYGAQSLSKALILANDPALSLLDLKYHGLSTRPTTADGTQRAALQAYVDNPDVWEMEQEFAVTHGGVFPHLARIASDPVPPQGQVLRLKELLRIVPDLADRYSRHYGEVSHCLYLYSAPKIDEESHFGVFFSTPVQSDISQVFPELLRSDYEETTYCDNPGYRSVNAVTEIPPLGSVESGAVAGRYLVRPHATGICRSITVLYAAMFILSNVVRYKPAFWMNVVDGTNSGAASIAEALTNVFARRFPNDVLQGIWHERFTYGSAAYFQ